MNEPEILEALKELGKTNESYALLHISLLRMKCNYPKQYRRIMNRLIKRNFKDADALQAYLNDPMEVIK